MKSKDTYSTPFKTRITNIWLKESLSGGMEFRASSKILFTILPLVLAVVVYNLLLVLEGMEGGSEIIIVLAYGVVVLVAMLTLVVIMISIIDYLRKFE